MIIIREINKWLQAFFAQIPGGVGKLCRRVYFKLVLKKLGNNCSFGRGITITNFSKISIGNDVTLSDGSFLYANEGGEIQIGNSLHMNTNSCLAASNLGKIIIGDNVLIAQNVVLRASNHCFDRVDLPINKQGHKGGEIIIEDDCWIGANVVVVPNVTIGRHRIVGAGAVVTSDVTPYSIIGGVPAKLIRYRI